MKNPKVGERVKVYQLGLCGTLTDFCSVIYDINEYGALLVHKERNILANPKQCRRLVKKKRKEVWVNEYAEFIPNTMPGAWPSKEIALKYADKNYPPLGTFRYIRAKDQS